MNLISQGKSEEYNKQTHTLTHTWDNSIVLLVAKKTPSSNGGEGRPSSSSTTDGFTDSGVPSVPMKYSTNREFRTQFQ